MKNKLLILFFITITTSVYAQPGSLDPSFNPTDTGFGNGDGANSDIRSIAKQVDGKIIIGGSFTEYNGFV